jgi:hypothetical protein
MEPAVKVKIQQAVATNTAFRQALEAFSSSMDELEVAPLNAKAMQEYAGAVKCIMETVQFKPRTQQDVDEFLAWLSENVEELL